MRGGDPRRELGLKVLVADKARFPRDKTCGDGLTSGALRQLRVLGVDVSSLRSYAPVRTAVLVAPNGREVELPLRHDGSLAAVVTRRELDALLVARTRDAGVTVCEQAALAELACEGDAVDVGLANGRRVRARWVVAADGHYSTVRRLLEPSPADLGTWHAFRQYFRGVEDDRLWVFFERDLLPGYAWVFPVGGGRANVGFGVLRNVGGRTRAPSPASSSLRSGATSSRAPPSGACSDPPRRPRRRCGRGRSPLGGTSPVSPAPDPSCSRAMPPPWSTR